MKRHRFCIALLRIGMTRHLRLQGRRGLVFSVAWLALLYGSTSGCADATYCQAGPKHGTQCYSRAEVEPAHRAQGRMPPPEEWSERWPQLGAGPQAGPGRVSSAASSPRSARSSPARAASVELVYAEQGASPPSDVRREAAERYVSAAGAWLEEHWQHAAKQTRAAHPGPLPCPDERPLAASLTVRVDGRGRISGWSALSLPGDRPFGSAVEALLENLLGRSLPAPPDVFADLQPRSMHVELTNQGLPCGGRAPQHDAAEHDVEDARD